MKVDRRSFLGLGLGAAAGIGLSPATWKITDDLSIWTQNWPWTPVPPDGAVNYAATACPLCPGGCGLSVRRIDTRPVKIEGIEGHPVNDGGVCLHGISGLQYLYDPARVKTPLKKTEAGFEAISWDEAIALAAGKLADAGEKSACISGTDKGTIAGLFRRLMLALGSGKFMSMTDMDMIWEKTIGALHGVEGSAGFDLDNSDYILSFGSGLVEGWGSPVHNFKANASRKERGAKLVQIDPRLSNTAALADLWVPANPGTETELALGICSALVSESLVKGTAADAAGFAEFSEMVTTHYSPDTVAEITGVPAGIIRTIARDFAHAKAPLAVAGKGRGYTGASLREFAAVHALNCLAGNINAKGGFWLKPAAVYETWPELDSETALTDETVEGFFNHGADVDVLLVYNANPCYAMKDSAAVRTAVENIDFVISFSSYLDETAQVADLVLPSHTFLERLEDLPARGGIAKSIVSLCKPVIDPVFDTKNPGDSVLMIARAIDAASGAFPWESYEECLEAVTADVWDALSGEGYALISEEADSETPDIDFTFLTDNRKGISFDGNPSDYPLVLVPVNNFRLAAGSLTSSPFAVKIVSDTELKGNLGFVEINPATAKPLKLSQGDKVTLTTPKGSAMVKVNLTEGIMPGVVGVDAGLGHDIDHNPYIDGKGININELIGPVLDNASGSDAAWGIRAKISRA